MFEYCTGVRWDNLAMSSDQDALFGADEVVERTFDTPDFRGMTFYEIRARSILNKVPGGSRLPFGWTINPYRGAPTPAGTAYSVTRRSSSPMAA